MKQLPFILALILLFCISCHTNNGNAITDKGNSDTLIAVKLELPKSFSKSLKGSINSSFLTMNLVKEDTVLSGTYYYDKIGMPLTITGSITADGNFKLTERDRNYVETGTFSGAFKNDSVLEGNWTNSKTKKVLPFTLHVNTKGFVTLAFEKKYNENCDEAEKNRKHMKADMEMWDTACTKIDVEVMTVAAPVSPASEKINQSIVKNICAFSMGDGTYKSIDELMNSVNEKDAGGYDLSIGASVVTNDNNILCVCIGQYFYGYGAAHPNHGSQYFNYDIRTGEQISLDDILLPGYKSKLNKIGEKKFVEANGAEGWDFEPGHFELNNDFAITPGGLLFSYDPYEIGAYVMGDPQVFIPFSDISDLVNPNSIVGQWAKK